MFTTPCFIRKCTPELKSKLEDIGYHRRPIKEKYDKHKFLLVCRDGCYNSSTDNETGIENYIDCGDNEELFLAMAALRDDNDYMQWFVTEANQSWVNIGTYSPKGSFELCLQGNRYNKEWVGKEEFCSCVVPAHKATIEELIEHFKK